MIEIQEIVPDQLDSYAKIPISFIVSYIIQIIVLSKGMGGILLQEVALENPYIKDYDKTLEGGPMEWVSHFEISSWGFILAVEDTVPVGAAAVAYNTNGVNMLEERDDLTVLWDIRVRPDRRGKGIGKDLFNRGLKWPTLHGCRQMKIETQNITISACRF